MWSVVGLRTAFMGFSESVGQHHGPETTLPLSWLAAPDSGDERG